VQAIYERSRGLVTQQIQNNIKQWANSPKLLAGLLGFAGYLISESELDPRLRELAVCGRCGPWDQAMPILTMLFWV
jgi:hypothetical protein